MVRQKAAFRLARWLWNKQTKRRSSFNNCYNIKNRSIKPHSLNPQCNIVCNVTFLWLYIKWNQWYGKLCEIHHMKCFNINHIVFVFFFAIICDDNYRFLYSSRNKFNTHLISWCNRQIQIPQSENSPHRTYTTFGLDEDIIKLQKGKLYIPHATLER